VSFPNQDEIHTARGDGKGAVRDTCCTCCIDQRCLELFPIRQATAVRNSERFQSRDNFRHVQPPPLARLACFPLPLPLPLILKSPFVSPRNAAAEAMQIVHSHRLELSRQPHMRCLASQVLTRDHISPESHPLILGHSFLSRCCTFSISFFLGIDPLLSTLLLLVLL
jgi:hypothetical protein